MDVVVEVLVASLAVPVAEIVDVAVDVDVASVIEVVASLVRVVVGDVDPLVDPPAEKSGFGSRQASTSRVRARPTRVERRCDPPDIQGHATAKSRARGRPHRPAAS